MSILNIFQQRKALWEVMGANRPWRKDLNDSYSQNIYHSCEYSFKLQIIVASKTSY